MEPENLGFEVDTQLFRELGELLVGRDSTALAELVKNAYDADATHVSVRGSNLHDPTSGVIEIRDDGHGMNYTDFREGFLKIASRRKNDEENRISPLLGRRVTGEKGIGRLAAHKLASVLEVESYPHPTKGDTGIRARIDWSEIERLKTFQDIQGSGAVMVETLPPNSEKQGTTVRLTKLRKVWTPETIKKFISEMATYRLPKELLLDPEQELGAASIIGILPIALSVLGSNRFDIRLQGEFAAGEDFLKPSLSQAEWVLEVVSDGNQVEFQISQIPEKAKFELPPYSRSFTQPSTNYHRLPLFEARIYYKERSWTNVDSGVGAYFEGFRVFPYGESGNDWLALESQYSSRSRTFDLPKIFGEPKADEGLRVASAKSYFGGVFLNKRSHPDLKMLINREGFVANDSFDSLTSVLKTGLNMLVRARSEIHEHEEKAKKVRDQKTERVSPVERAEQSISDAAAAAEDARQQILAGDTDKAIATFGRAVNKLRLSIKTADDLMSEHRLVSVLAGLGTHLSGFTHDIQQMVAEINLLESILKEIAQSAGLPNEFRSRLNQAIGRLADAKQLVEYQGLFLADMVSADARRRRSKQPLRECFDASFRFVSGAADRAMIQVINEIQSSAETPSMFRSELTVVLTNLLSNAVKAAGEGGAIWAHSKEHGRELLLTIENTGVVVDIEDSQRFFEPFVSTSENVEPSLGKGMGLGLTIVRSILDNSKATIKFVAASEGFSTAIQIAWKR